MTRALAAFDAVTERLMLPLTVLGLVVGLAATVAGNDELAWWCWTVPAVLVGAVARDLDRARPARRPGGRRRHRAARDRGALLLGESLAASVIAVMLATGEALERYAEGRAHRELSALVSRAPRIVHRYEDGSIADRGIGDVAAGDRLLVKPGEVVPVDGIVIGAAATLDESALTGEAAS